MRIRLGMVVAGVVVFLLSGVGYASAAQPAVQGCFGASVAADAQRGRDSGQDVAALAQSNTGVGEIVQEIQAGNVPDAVFPNTCND